MASVNQSPEVKSILKQTHDLTIALSNDPLGVAGRLLSKELIYEEEHSKMLVHGYTPAEKAAILVRAVRNTLEIAPDKFQVFLEILSNSEVVCAKEVVERLRSTYQSQLDQVVDRGSHESVGIAIASKIETLEDQFDSLRTRIINELSANPDVTVQTLLPKLTGLPLSLRKEYESSIAKRIPSMRTEASINELFIHLNPLTSFIDYELIEYLIKKFGSGGLWKDMRSYCSEMIVFMKETTVRQLINHLPGQAEVPPKFSLIEAKIGEDASECTLEELNTIRKRFCSEIKLSEIVLHLMTVVESKSFIVRWLVPSLVSDVVKSAENVNQSFYREYKITSLTLDGMWLYMSEAEIDAMWSQVRVSEFKVQFHAMYKQIMYELEMAQITGHQLSSYFMKSLEYHQSTSDWLSHELLNHKLPVSVVDFRVLAAAIEGFGSDCLKSVMSSYSKYISTFLKKSTAQQLTSSSAIQLQPSGYSIVRCRFKEEPSQYTLDKLSEFRTRFCGSADLNELCFFMDEINTETSGSFTVKWLVPHTIIIPIIMYARNADQLFYYIFNITSLTLDGMWLYMSEAEIDAVWSQLHVSDAKFNDQFHTMCKQIVCEMEAKNVSEDHLSLYFQSLDYQEQISDQLSLAVLEEEFPASFVDFRVLKAVIERFGSDCLKRVMRSYCNYMLSIFTNLQQMSAQQLVNMSTVQHTDFKYFKIAQCRILEEPSNYRLETLLKFRARFCTTINLGEECFIMSEVNTETKDSFTVNWLVPQAFIADIMKSTRNCDPSFYQEYKITSLTLDEWWLHMSEAELEVMWIHMSNEKHLNQFQIMHKQIILELKLQNTSTDELSRCLMNQHPNLQKDTSIFLSEAILTFPFPPSGFFLDFDMLCVIIKEFGCDCLRGVMMSYCKFMSGFTEQLTIQQLLNLPPVPTEDHEGFIEVECRIMEEPSGYTCDKILSIKNSICAEIDFSGFMLTMNHIKKQLSDSFVVSWLVPTQFAPNVIESADRIDSKFYVRKSIASFSIGNQWVYNPRLVPFGSKLKEKYQQSQGSTFPVELTAKKIFPLPMIQRERVQRGHIEDRFVRMTIRGRIDDILHAKSPVELEHIFRNTLRGGEIILVEGAPGSGKSTLTVHISQRWGKGELFQQFTIVILIQLRDPAVQRAQTIADLLPVENPEVIAAELIATNGRGVLWVLDGWDELPPHLQRESIFRKLLPPKPCEEILKGLKSADPLNYAEYAKAHYGDEKLWKVYLQNNPQQDRLLLECSVVVTSRPISSGDLHPVVSSRIEVLGFTPEEQRRYFTECLKGDTKALEALLEKIQENPVVQSICYLPLNAAFIVHTFKYRDQSLPNTEYEIYLSVILSCIQRHYDREGRGHDLPRELSSLDDLSKSEAVKEPFQCLCELAYRGVMENKVIFSSSDLPQGSNTLSLLQAIESFLQSGKSVFYNFLHLSIQEVLSAYYIIIKLSDSEQVSQFQQLFNQPRFAPVFQFYAAITKLKSPGIHQVIDRTVEAKSKPLLVSLLRCLHEAQDPALCLYVAERLEYELDLSETSLSPLDCLSVSFFLSSVAGKEISVDLAQCQVGDLGVKCLTKYLSVSNHTDLVTINLKGNDIHDEGASHVAKMLHFIEHLHLDVSENPIEVTGTSYVFQAVIRDIARLKTLILIICTRAQTIADQLPVENAREIATGLRATDIRCVLLINALQPHLYTVFFSPMHNSVLVTSHSIIDNIIKDESKPLLVLLRCLHEAQDPALCLYVAERLEYKLDLSMTTLSPLDCLSISFFLSSLTGKEISVNLRSCAIGDLGAQCLSKYLHADNKLEYVSKITVDLTDNKIYEEGTLHHNIARMLYFIEHLYLSYNPIGDTGASLIAEVIRETSTLKILILHKCSITSRGAEDLSRSLAQNSSLEKLDISCNYVGDDGISHMAEALKRNKQLKELWIGDCAMTDKGAASLASALTVNNSLKMLHIGGGIGALTEDGLKNIADSLINKSLFEELAIPGFFVNTTADHLSKKVNKARKGNGLPHIQIYETTKATSATLVVLSEKDLVHIMEQLQSCSDKWREIGLSLGFTQHELSDIPVGAPVSYLQELLSQWVQWPTTDHPSHPTVRALCTALRSRLVGLGSLAEEVEKEMKQCAIVDMKCPVCLNMQVDPCTLSCGHTFCQLCLARMWKSDKKFCPVCKETWRVFPAISYDYRRSIESAHGLKVEQVRKEYSQEDKELIEKYLEAKRMTPFNLKSESLAQEPEEKGQLPDTWKLPGVEVCGETSVAVRSSQGQLIEWNGLKLHIHAGSLPEGLQQCTIFIKASLAGDYEFPENTSLVSGIFWLRCEPQCVFINPITVEIQHCSTKRNLSKLKIVRALCNQKSLPYKFKPLKGGSFNAETFYGAIDMKGFSGLATIEENPDSERMYYSQLFYRSYLRHQQTRHEIHIPFVWNTELHLNYISQNYPKSEFFAGCYTIIEIEGKEIEVVLDTAKWTKVMDDQWEIHPAQPIVTKAALDTLKEGQAIPSCVLEARPIREDYPQLLHQIILNGIKPPHHRVILSYLPPIINRDAHLPVEDGVKTTRDFLYPEGQVQLKHLKLIKWRDERGEIQRFYLMENISPNWRDIGELIGLSVPKLTSIATEHHGIPLECCRAVLDLWLKNPPTDYPITWRGLIELLKDCRLGQAVSELQSAVS